jgi:hypothetical protein
MAWSSGDPGRERMGGLDRCGIEDFEYAKRKNRGGWKRWVSFSQAHSTKSRIGFRMAVWDRSWSLEFWETIEGWEWSGMSQQKRDGEGCVLLYKEVGLSVS